MSACFLSFQVCYRRRRRRRGGGGCYYRLPSLPPSSTFLPPLTHTCLLGFRQGLFIFFLLFLFLTDTKRSQSNIHKKGEKVSCAKNEGFNKTRRRRRRRKRRRRRRRRYLRLSLPLFLPSSLPPSLLPCFSLCSPLSSPPRFLPLPLPPHLRTDILCFSRAFLFTTHSHVHTYSLPLSLPHTPPS